MTMNRKDIIQIYKREEKPDIIDTDIPFGKNGIAKNGEIKVTICPDNWFYTKFNERDKEFLVDMFKYYGEHILIKGYPECIRLAIEKCFDNVPLDDNVKVVQNRIRKVLDEIEKDLMP